MIVYRSAEDPYARSLFLLFSDEISGHETYTAGRYLDLEEQGGDDYELDFNIAYDPYCAYSEDYACPMLPVGEQAFRRDSGGREELQIGMSRDYSRDL